MLILWSNLVRTEKLGKFDHHHISGFGICKDQHQARTSWCTFYIAHVCNFFGSKMTSFRFDINYQIVVSLVTRMLSSPLPHVWWAQGDLWKQAQETLRFMYFCMSLGPPRLFYAYWRMLSSIRRLFWWRRIDFVDVNKAFGHCLQVFFFFFDQAFSSSMWVYLVAKFASRNGEGLNNPHLPSQKEVIQNTSYNYGFMLPCLCKSIVVMLEWKSTYGSRI